MKRFTLSSQASADLDEIRRYLDLVPERHAAPIRRGLRTLLEDIAANPQRGAPHSLATRILGEQIQSRSVPPYRIFYRMQRGIPEIAAIFDTRRDVASLLAKRIQ